MILKTMSGQVEVTADALVIRTKKGERALPFDTIESVDYVAPKNFLAAGHVRPLLVGDTTRSKYVNLDANFFVPVTTTREDRAQAADFAKLLIERVSVSGAKRQHPDLAQLVSDPTELQRAAAAVAASERRSVAGLEKLERHAALQVEKSERQAAVEAKKFERRTAVVSAKNEHQQAAAAVAAAKVAAAEAEFTAKYPEIDSQINGPLGAAVRHAASGAVELEHASMRHAVRLGKAAAGRKGVQRAEGAIERLRGEGKLLIGVKRLGAVEPEGRFNATGRTNSLGGLLSGGGVPVEVYSDRVVQGESCKPIDAHTRAKVFIDGEQQVVSTNPFNSRKENTDDRRRAEFQVTGPGWTFRLPVDPDRLHGPRALAGQINAAADLRSAERSATIAPRVSGRAHGPAVPVPAASAPIAAGSQSIVEQLEKLQALRQSGAIDEQEFAVLKSSLLEALTTRP